QSVPRLFHRRDRRDKFRLAFRGQTTAKPADVDSGAFGIVVRRDIDLDVSRIGDGLPSSETSAAENSDDQQDGEGAVHFGLKSRKSQPMVRGAQVMSEAALHHSKDPRKLSSL